MGTTVSIMNLRRYEAPAEPEVKATSITIPTTDVAISRDSVSIRASLIAGGLLAFRERVA